MPDPHMTSTVYGLVTETSYRQHRPHFEALGDCGHRLEWLLLADDGALRGPKDARPDGAHPKEARPDGAHPKEARLDGAHPKEARPEVGWLSSDVFFSGLIDRFFEIVEQAPDFRWLQSAAAGVDLPHYERLMSRGARMCNAHLTAIPIAEYALRAVLDVFQQAGRWRDAQARSRWQHHNFREVWRSRWLIIGFGAIGSEIARRARAFEAHVTGVRRRRRGDEPADAMITPAEVPDALPSADVVVLAAPATPETENLVDGGFLSAMKPESVLVNVARGRLIDDKALLAALDADRPGTAVLDVFNTEPLEPDHPYWTHPKVVLTPHSSGGGVGRWERGAELFCDNLRRLLSGEPLINEVTTMQLLTTDLPFAPGQGS